ncbi:MAG TPA: pyridoxamine 5'-phosphate oxidase family protein [Caldimonas sp.]|nr:pyridoxamine 5'-phosphate oxidase family protein [Caldimonas sp.]HEX2540756.1 pyridoxamine 5'-phosphate oxidase family protein [Caldimonas sp.]
MNDNTESRQLLWKMIKDIRFAMFTTRHGNGHLHSRPMTTQNKEIGADGSLWFFMSRSSGPVDDLKSDPIVNLAYADPDADTYVSVSGTAAVVEDAARKNQLWNKQTEAWFPKGPTDPDLALVQVQIVHANYWDVKDSKLVQLYEMAKAVVTGKPPTDMSEQGEVRMR